MTRRPPSRRRILASASALGLAAFAGCLDGRFVGGEPDADSADRAETDDGDSDTDDNSDDGDRPDDDSEHDSNDTTESVHADYETTRVRVVTLDGEELGSVTAAIADTNARRELGLSDTESLPEDRGMLFVYDELQTDRTYVMRHMDFGIDIVYADSEGVITKICHEPAPEPGEDGENQTCTGDGQYVLEVNYEWTADRGVETGDELAFEL